MNSGQPSSDPGVVELAGTDTTARRGDDTVQRAGPQLCTVHELMEHAALLATRGARLLVGIAGPPGAGKSTLAQAIIDHVGDRARLVGMDGFHLSQRQLVRLRRFDRKGAPETFDAAGFVALVERLAHPGGEVIYAPEFSREIEEPIAGSIAVEPEAQMIVIEGNYLLVADHPWGRLRDLFTEVWYCERSEDERIADLIARHHAFGKSMIEAERWALGSDQHNAELIAATRERADRIVMLKPRRERASAGEPPAASKL